MLRPPPWETAVSEIIRPSNPIVQALENALSAARAGRIASVGIVMVSPLGQYSVQAAGSGESIYVGCDVLKAQIGAQVTNPQALRAVGNV